MTFSELLISAALITIFLAGFSSAAKPVIEANLAAERAMVEAKETSFVINSFRAACRTGSYDFGEWRRAVSVVEDTKDITISKLSTKDGSLVWRLTCIVFGRAISVYAEGGGE